MISPPASPTGPVSPLPNEEPTPGTPTGAEPDVVRCAFCDADAVHRCERCSTPHCDRHGGAVCAACSDPASGLPSVWPLRAAVVGLAVSVALGIALLLTWPRLPGETVSPASAVPPAGTVAGGGAGAGPAAGQSPATPTAQPTPQRYTVKPGDTLNALAAQFGTTVEAIAAANPGVNPASLQVGQELSIPVNR